MKMSKKLKELLFTLKLVFSKVNKFSIDGNPFKSKNNIKSHINSNKRKKNYWGIKTVFLN